MTKKAHTGQVIISGYASELYDDSLTGWYKAQKKARTQTAAVREEILWMNFEQELTLFGEVMNNR